MEASWNRGTPKSSISMGFSTINQPFGGASIYGTHQHPSTLAPPQPLWAHQPQKLRFLVHRPRREAARQEGRASVIGSDTNGSHKNKTMNYHSSMHLCFWHYDVIIWWSLLYVRVCSWIMLNMCSSLRCFLTYGSAVRPAARSLPWSPSRSRSRSLRRSLRACFVSPSKSSNKQVPSGDLT